MKWAAVTGNGKDISLARAAVQELADALRGPLLLQGNEGYEVARRVINHSIDKHPALIAQCTGVADVQNAVRFAKSHDLLVSVKCGGHSFSGKATCDGGLMIDLSPMRGVRVDPIRKTAWVEGGSLLGDIDHNTMAFGLVTPAGTVSHTGVGGLTLGGGFGRVARRFGLTLDNVKSIDIVTANGELRRASAEENPDLYWAVRGGGGNFGVVTNFEFTLHPMQRTVVGGDIGFPISRARELINFHAEMSAEATRELYADCALITGAGGNPGFVMMHVCYSGPANQAERVLAPFKKLGQPIFGEYRAVDYVALQRSWDNTDPRSRGEYQKSGFVPDIPSELIEAVSAGYASDPGRSTTMFFQHSGGAIEDVSNTATAFAHRESICNMFCSVGWDMGTDPAPHVAWLKDYWSSVEPFTSGLYINDVTDDESQQFINKNYRENYPRLVRVKNRFDPTNLFRLNANVQPNV